MEVFDKNRSSASLFSSSIIYRLQEIMWCRYAIQRCSCLQSLCHGYARLRNRPGRTTLSRIGRFDSRRSCAQDCGWSILRWRYPIWTTTQLGTSIDQPPKIRPRTFCQENCHRTKKHNCPRMDLVQRQSYSFATQNCYTIHMQPPYDCQSSTLIPRSLQVPFKSDPQLFFILITSRNPRCWKTVPSRSTINNRPTSDNINTGLQSEVNIQWPWRTPPTIFIYVIHTWCIQYFWIYEYLYK